MFWACFIARRYLTDQYDKETIVLDTSYFEVLFDLKMDITSNRATQSVHRSWLDNVVLKPSFISYMYMYHISFMPNNLLFFSIFLPGS